MENALDPMDRAGDCYQAGMAALRQGYPLRAAELLRDAIRLDPNNAEYLVHATEVFRRCRWIPDAIAAGRHAVQLRPEIPAAHNNLGLALLDGGQLGAAETSFRQAINLEAGYAKAYHNLGNVLRLQHRLEEASTAMSEALRIRSDYPQALNGLGLIRKQQHQHQEAIRYFRAAINLRPDYPQALLNLGNALGELDRFADAEQCLRRALAVDPAYANALHDLGALYERQRRLAEAAEVYAQALKASPGRPDLLASLENARRHLCDWADHGARLHRLSKAVDDCLREGRPSPLWPAASIRFPTSNAQRLGIARQFAAKISAATSASAGGRLPDDRSLSVATPNVLRVGFLSHEFGDHIVSYLMQGFYRLLDRSKFQVFGFAYSPDDGSELRRRIAQDCDRFIDISALAPADAARRIRSERVDILFDMNSYMPGGRPEIAARRPAPVQVSYRYPATMGADWIDYILADRIVIPAEDQASYLEKPVYLPDAYLVTSYEEPVQEDGRARASYGLPADQFVYGSFNQSHKLNPQIFDVWMQILDRVAGSVLWQIESNSAVQENLRREAQRRGIDPRRIVFTGKLPIREHLARFRHADLILDCLVHGAIVTAADALWAGLPLLTILGDTFTSRAAASLLTAAGLPALITADLHEYEEQAVHLAQHADELRSLRTTLTQNRGSCPLFDTPRFVRHLELALLEMWRIHQAGEPPQPIDVSALLQQDGPDARP